MATLATTHAYPMAILAGILITLQAGCASALGIAIGSFQYAALFSLVTSLVVYGIVIWGSPYHRAALYGIVTGEWKISYALSGFPGAAYITAFAMSISEIGSTISVVAAITGQLIIGLCLEWSTLTGRRSRAIIGAAVTATGTAVVVLAGVGLQLQQVSSESWLYITMMVGTGASIVWQFKVLAHMNKQVLSPWAAATVSASSGVVAALILVVVYALVVDVNLLVAPIQAMPIPTSTTFWWYGAGIVGVGIMSISAIAAAALGPRIYMIPVTLGYLLAGSTLDVFNPAIKHDMWWLKGIGLAFVVAGVAICKYEKKALSVSSS